MQPLIEFLITFIKLFLPFLPVLPWEGGVRTTGIPFGPMLTAEVKPGLRWKWPIIGGIHTVATKRQTIRTPVQNLRSEDGAEITVSVVITHAVSDPVKVWVDVQDYEVALEERAMVFIAEFVSQTPLKQITIESVGKAVQPRVKREATRWGCEVENVGVVELANPHVLRVMAEWPKIIERE